MNERNHDRLQPALWGAYYARSFHYSGKPKSRFEFSFIDNEDQTITNSIKLPETLPKLRRPSESHLKAAKTEGLTLKVENLERRELRELSCLIAPAGQTLTIRSALMDMSTQTCTFTSSDLSGLSPGEYRLQVRATWLSYDVNHADKIGGRKYLTVITVPYEISI